MRALAVTVVGLALAGSAPTPAPEPPSLRVVLGVTAEGDATPQWLAMLRQRLDDSSYQAVAGVRRPLTPAEQAWAELIRSRVEAWQREIPAVARPFRPVAPPQAVTIVLGNRGASDAFTHDPTTIGHDLSALQREYGDAALPVNHARVDRFFRHEYTHLMQKAWRPSHPYAADTPLRAALADIWAEGMGNYYSLSESWRPVDGRPSETAARTLAALEPRFVARLAALACTTPERAAALTADLSSGPFVRKWGAVTPGVWLASEGAGADSAFRALVEAGPDGVWALAERHLSPELDATLREARLADSVCTGH